MFARQPVAALPSLQMNFPTDWLASLTDLLKVLKTPFERVDALLVAMADDFAGGVMLRWLLYLFPKSRREDGAIYKSAAEWQAQVGLSKNQVDRLKKLILPRCGVDVTVRKANGAPTCHYYLDGWRFLRRLGAVLRLPIPYLLFKLQQSRNPSSGKQEMDLLESRKSLTNDSTNESNRQSVNDSSVDSKIVDFKSTSVLDMLRKAGLSRQHALPFGALAEDVVEACITSANEPGVRNRVAYLKAALKNQLEQQATQPSQAKPLFQNVAPESPADTEAPPPNPLPVRRSDEWTDTLRRLREGQAAGVTQGAAPEAVPANLAVMVNENFSAQAAWNAAYHQLELQLDRTSFDTYLRAAKLVGFEADCFVIQVHSAHARDMLQHRLYRNVARILRDVTGREVTVRFEADEQGASVGQGLKRFLPVNEG